MNKQGIFEKATPLREESLSEYNLEQSEKGIGQLYPILEAKDGEIIDGLHREKADKNWKRMRLNHIDTEEKKLVARLVANFHRRQVTMEEKEEWINGLARIYKKQGFRIRGENRANEIVEKIREVTGISKRENVLKYLEDKFKQVEQAHGREKGSYDVMASQRIETELGRDYVERHREEVLAEESPKIERAVREKTARELLVDKNFQQRVLVEISKPKVVTPSEPCPSGVCELPPVIESGKPVDVRAEALQRFWKDNPSCLCKTCGHYEKCGVIR